jgi:hemolysin activation/secretion protein
MAKKKEIKKMKESQKIEAVGMDTKSQVLRGIKVLVVVLVVFGLFYLLAWYITSKNASSTTTNTTNTSNTEAEIDYTTILASDTFKMGGNYLVLFYDMSDKDIKSTYTSLLSTYKAKSSHLTIYSVDSSSSFNKKYISTSSNTNPESIDDLKVNGPTLMEINDGKCSSYVEGKDAISSYLG